MKFTLEMFCRFRPASLALSAAGALLLSNCQATGGAHHYSTNYDPPAHRPSNPSRVHVNVSTGKQAIYVMEGDRVLMATPCSVGTPQAPTPKGNFKIFNKDFAHRRASSPGAGYPMSYWCEFAPAYGLHWGYVKPYPCTHGCIRMPQRSAAKFYAMVSVGTPVNISQSQPQDATAGASLPVLDDSTLPDPPDSYLHSAQFFEDQKYKGPMFAD
jgi:hypothetical protein